MGIIDIAAVVALGLFALWGGLRGFWRQVVGVGLLAGALWVAGMFSEKLEDLVGKVVTLEPEARCLTAWAVAFLGVYVVASVLVGVFGKVVGGLKLPGFSWPGALLGLAKGAVIVVIAVYAVLWGWKSDPRPAFAADTETSVAAGLAVRVAEPIRKVLPMPACLERELDAMDVRVRR